MVLAGVGTSATAQNAAGPGTQPPAHQSADGVHGRRVSEVVEERRAARRLSSLDPSLFVLANDSTAYIDSTNRVFFVEPAPSVPSPTSNDPTTLESVGFPTGSPFTLHSRPGASRTVYLDFDGETVSNTAWNVTTGIAAKTVAPYDLDGLPATFSFNEQNNIKAIWQIVADDFAPFDIDVTTERPSTWDDLVRSSLTDQRFGAFAVITPDRWLCTFCGGIAYHDIFVQNLTPSMLYGYAWTFYTSPSDWETIGNVISHEVGHNMGLRHDGVRGGSDYYSGNGTWGPIMGNPPRPRFVQWSRGEYVNANNQEDDVAIMSGLFGPAADESTSFTNAVQVPPGSFVTTADGNISSATDVDYYAFDVLGGFLYSWISTPENGRTLYPEVTLFNSAMQPVAQTVASLTADHNEFYNSTLPPGRYFIAVRGVGSTSAGFSSYGSLGRYNLKIRRPSKPTPPVPSVAAVADQRLEVSMVPSMADGYALSQHRVQLCDERGSCSNQQTVNSSPITLVAPQKTGSYRARVVGVNPYGVESDPGYSEFVSVLSRPTPPTVHKVRFAPSTRQLTVEWFGAQGHSPVELVRLQIVVVNMTNGAFAQRMLVPLSSGIETFDIPSDWDGAQVSISMQAYSSYPDPWASNAANVVTINLDRPAAPGAGATTVPRGTVPPAPGAGSGERTAAPPA